MDNHVDRDNAPPVQSATVYNTMLEHIQEVSKRITRIAEELIFRTVDHDQSKFGAVEFPVFVKFTPRLKDITYDSTEYKEALKQMQSALAHHYKHNPHHPEYYSSGIRGMNLVDIVEMFCDWFASTLRQKDGNIQKSIEANQLRFGFSSDLKYIFLNTVKFLEGHGTAAPDELNEKVQQAAQRMSVKTAQILLKDFSADDLQALRETCCNGCKGDRWFIESECRFHCSAFIDATLTALGDVIVEEG